MFTKSIFVAMKLIHFLLSFLISATAFTASAQDEVLLPEKFILNKGENLKVHLITARQFMQESELKYQPSQTDKFTLYEGSKKIDLIKMSKDSAAPVLTYTSQNAGLALLEMNRKYAINEQEKDDFLKYADDEGLTKISEKAKNINKDNIREKYTWYLKSLVYTDKPSGNLYEKVLNDDLEIILKQNPYKFSYGDDVTAVVNFKGKPAPAVTVLLYVKTVGGNVFPQKLSTDAAGQIYFKLSREGIYLLRTLVMLPSTDKNVDYDTWVASYSFGFSSSNELPNTYKEFGFGNVH